MRVRLRCATATTPATSTGENKPDTLRSPPLIYSTKGAQMKKATSPVRSGTDDRDGPLRVAGGVIPVGGGFRTQSESCVGFCRVGKKRLKKHLTETAAMFLDYH